MVLADNKSIKSVNRGYIESFDGLRAYGAITVLLLHGGYGYFKGGWIGVDVFFALSGYLITSIILKEIHKNGSLNFKNFYARRFIRLTPPLIICIILADLLAPISAVLPNTNQIVATLASLFYFTNLLKYGIAGNLSHTWSLCVEEHYYLFWPILCLWLALVKSNKKRLYILFGFFAFSAALKIFVSNIHISIPGHYFDISADRFTLCRIDTILLGSILAFVEPQINKTNFAERLKKRSNVLIPVFLLAFLVIVLMLKENTAAWLSGGFLITDLLCIFLTWLAIENPKHILFTNKIASWVGKRSYGIYIYHFPIFKGLEFLRHHNSISSLIFVTFLRIALSLLIAGISYRYIETPILKLKRHFKGDKDKTASEDKPIPETA